MLARALSCLAVLLLAGCPSSSNHTPDQGEIDGWTPPPVSEEDRKAAASAVNQFAIDLHKQLGAQDGDVFFSPASVAAALGMTWSGAKGPTADQLAKALHLSLPPERAHPALGALLATRSEGAATLAAGNRLWCAPDDLLPAFLKQTRDAYGAEVGKVDFRADAEGARKTINQWIEQRTRERIKDLIPPGTLTDLTRLVLTNAIYFKGTWKEQFEKGHTRTGSFHLADATKVEVPLMHGTLPARFFAGDEVALVELPYEGDGLSMVVVVPNDGVAALEKRLTADALARWIGSARGFSEVEVTLPKFKIEVATDLVPPLKALGVVDLFDMNAADLSGMNGKKDLSVSAALHKAFVEVNEEGTEAAAATAVVVATRSMPEPPPVLRADRPFLFLIRDVKTGLILFMGRETDPRS
jgi:serpin B